LCDSPEEFQYHTLSFECQEQDSETVELLENEEEHIPCEICGNLISFSLLTDHQVNCSLSLDIMSSVAQKARRRAVKMQQKKPNKQPSLESSTKMKYQPPPPPGHLPKVIKFPSNSKDQQNQKSTRPLNRFVDSPKEEDTTNSEDVVITGVKSLKSLKKETSSISSGPPQRLQSIKTRDPSQLMKDFSISSTTTPILENSKKRAPNRLQKPTGIQGVAIDLTGSPPTKPKTKPRPKKSGKKNDNDFSI